MNFLLIFGAATITGFLIFSTLKKYIDTKFGIPYIFLLGSFISLPLLYYIRAYFVSNLDYAIVVWVALIMLATILRRKSVKVSLHIDIKYLILFVILICLSFILFNKCFSYENSNFLIATNMYLDMGAHIPYIRSFSSDINFPFEIPFYASSNIQYHYMFNFFAGILEYTGVRLDIAYNLISSLTLASLLFIFIDFGNAVFRKKILGLLAFILFISPFNFSFFSLINSGILDVWRNQQYNFSSFLGDNTVGNFLYINTYLNQRHLLFSLAVALILVQILCKIIQRGIARNTFILLGLMTPLMYAWNISVFLMLIIVFLCFLFINNKKAILFWLFPVLVLGLIQAYPYINSSDSVIRFSPGYLIHSYFSLPRFVAFWLLNLGVSTVTIIGGFFMSNRLQKTLFLSVLPVFVLPNLFQFTNDMFDNHKFFNFWYMIICFYSAFFIIRLLEKRLTLKILATVLFIFSVISSISNVSVVKNDIYAKIPDYAKYPLIQFAKNIVSPQDISLTNGEIYDPLSIGGLKTYLGRSHYIFLYGGNPQERIVLKQNILQSSHSAKLDSYLDMSHVKYIMIYKDTSVKNILRVNKLNFDGKLKKIYEDDFGKIYKI